MHKYFCAFCFDKLSGSLVSITVGETELVAVRRMMVSVTGNREVETFPDDFVYYVKQFDPDVEDVSYTAETLGKMIGG